MEGVSYDDLTSKINEIVENPVFFFDSSFRLNGTSYKNKMNGKFLKEYEHSHILSGEIINELTNSGDLKTLKSTDEILIRNYESIKHPVMFKRVSGDKYVYGYICIYAKQRELTSDDEKLLELICKIAVHILNISGYSNKSEYMIFNGIIDGALSNRNEINAILDNLNLNQRKEDKRLMLVKTINTQQAFVYLVNKSSEYHAFIHNNDVVCFISEDRNTNKSIINELMENVDDEYIQIGVSDVFDDYVDMAEYYKQALESIEIGEKYVKTEHVHYSEDYRLLSLINKLDYKELKGIIDKRVYDIVKYDKENETQYLRDIEVYFKSGRNINKASQMMFIHKNSMYYRMEKIRELFKIDLENANDCFNVELSLKLLALINKEG